MEKEFKWAVETECDFEKFIASLKQAVGECPPQKTCMIHDYYLDNACSDLSLQKVALRIRQINGSFEATLKSRTRLIHGLAMRQEYTLPLTGADFCQALLCLQERKNWKGVSLSDLRVRFEIKNQRNLCTFSFGKAFCEAALDRYTIVSGDKQMACREIELELKSGDEKDFQTLIKILSDTSGLAPAKISKVATAEKLLKS